MMRKFILLIVLVLIAIQFYRPHKNNNSQESQNDFLVVENLPKPVAKIFKNSCYDCHSNYTNYRWYDNIAPISWYIDRKIQRGKLSLNFSKWRTYEIWQRRLFFQGGMIYDINIKRMPPKSYLLLHPEAKIIEKKRELIAKWIESVDLMKESF
jgi:tellurite resistance protein TehA-like permease